jgi:hypothetical protein
MRGLEASNLLQLGEILVSPRGRLRLSDFIFVAPSDLTLSIRRKCRPQFLDIEYSKWRGPRRAGLELLRRCIECESTEASITRERYCPRSKPAAQIQTTMYWDWNTWEGYAVDACARQSSHFEELQKNWVRNKRSRHRRRIKGR